MELSGLGELEERRSRLFKVTDSTCETHGEPLVQHKDYKPFCPICASEKVEQDERKLRETETEKAQNVNGRWLKQRSILSDRTMLAMTFDNFKEIDEETKTNKEKTLDLAREYYKGSKNNALLSGKYGTGKSHLAMAVLNQVNEFKDIRALFIATDELMRRIKSSFGNPESMYQEDRVVNMLIKADLLVLDDLGAEVGSVSNQSSANDWTVRVLNGILSGRTNKPTIFTTNLSVSGLKNTYDGRITSRIMRGTDEKSLVEFKKTTDKRSKIEY